MSSGTHLTVRMDAELDRQLREACAGELDRSQFARQAIREKLADTAERRYQSGAELANLYMEWGVVTGWGKPDSAEGPSLEEFITRVVAAVRGPEIRVEEETPA